MKKIVVAFLSMIAYTSCNAEELSIVGHGFSKHLQNHDFNERNYGAALRFEKGEYAFQAGVYRNSINKDTVYMGFDWSPIHFNIHQCLNFQAGLYAGGATGYEYTVTPVVGVQAALRCKDVFVRVRVMPDSFYNSKAVGAIEFGVILLRF
jgi:hypothetical protein